MEKPAVLPIQRASSLAQVAEERVRRAIIDGELPLGAPISERQLAEQLAISKTPVREALAQLSRERLVTIIPQKGVFVFTLSAQEVTEVCELRESLEASAMRLAIERNPEPFVANLKAVVSDMALALESGDLRSYLAADTAYHQAFFNHCGNSYMLETYNLFVGKIAALRTHLAPKPHHTDSSFAEHKKMVELLSEGDVKKALKVLDAHIGRTRNTYSSEVADISQAG